MLDQPGEETFGGLGAATLLNENVEDIAVSIDRTPEPETLSANRNDDLVYVPLVIRFGPVPADAGAKMATKAIDSQLNSFPADDDASLGKQVFNIGCAQSKAMISPDRICDDLTRKTKPL